MVAPTKRPDSTAPGISLPLAPTVLVVALVLAELALVRILPSQPSVAFGVAGLAVVAAFVLAAPSVLLVAVFPATYAYWRVGSGQIDLSVTDLATVLAIAAALPHVPWRSRALRRVLVALALYLALLGVSVLATPTARAFGEWAHRGVLFGGAVLIGAALAYRFRVTTALRALIVASAVVAIAAIDEALSSGFDPAYPLDMHKNFAGPALAIAAILLFFVPERFAFPPVVLTSARVLVLAGLLATQSRGAGLAVVAVLAADSIRRHEGRRRRLATLVLIGAVGLFAVSIDALIEEDKDEFSPVNERVDDFEFAFNEVWLSHPITGGGLKWFRPEGNTSSGPHNLAVAELSESGLVGLLGLSVLVFTTMRILWKRLDRLGRAAVLVFAFEVSFAMTGIFWLAGTLTLPMLIVGIAIGDAEANASAREPNTHPAATEQ